MKSENVTQVLSTFKAFLQSLNDNLKFASIDKLITQTNVCINEIQAYCNTMDNINKKSNKVVQI